MSANLTEEDQNAIQNGKGFTAFAMKNNVTVMVIVALLALTGISSYLSLPKQQDPGFIIRGVLISTAFPGANPRRV